MKRREKIYWAVLITVLVLVSADLSYIYYCNRQYRTTSVIRVLKIGKEEFEQDIPVESVSHRPTGNFRSFPVADQTQKNYYLHWDSDSNQLFISIVRGEGGGFYIMNGTYRVTDPVVSEKLVRFLESHEWE